MFRLTILSHNSSPLITADALMQFIPSNS
uniref:Uncharacterized protein n=1 Tax=Arundo donax TaxID=35708 RepID=A0A0A9AMC2_ARUDO